MNDPDVFDLEAEDVSQQTWEATVHEFYDDAFDSCGIASCNSGGCERTDCLTGD